MALALLVLPLARTACASPGLDFDRTFDAREDSRQSYYAATYRSGGQDHRLEVWRDGELRVRRRTDDAIETYVVRPPGAVEWTMTVLDLKRKIRTDVDRTNLLRIGHFTDWFAQAHSLSRPRGGYDLMTMKAGPPDANPIAACRWYRLTQEDRSMQICWSAAQRVPLVIADAQGTVVWRVTKLAPGPFAARVFSIDDRNFVRNDANADIQAD